MPNNTNSLVAWFGMFLWTSTVSTNNFPGTGADNHRSSNRLVDGEVDGVELVVASDLLEENPIALIFKNRKVANQIEESLLVKNSVKNDMKLRELIIDDRLPVDGPPRHESFLVCRQRSNSGLGTVGNHQSLVELEE